MNPLEFFTNYTYSHTLAGTVIIGVCAGALGPLVYLRRQSLLADAISHSSLPGLLAAFVAATLLGLDGRNTVMLVLGSIITGCLAVSAINVLPRIAPIKSDAAMAAVLTTFFSIGMLIMQYVSRTPLPGKAGIQDFLLGNASTLTHADVVSSLVIGGGALLLLSLVHTQQVAAVFDASFLRAARSTQTGKLHTSQQSLVSALGFLVLIVVTVIGVKVVGVVLMVAVVISPAAAARQWVRRVPSFIALSAVLGALCAVIGSYFSIAYAIPTGPAIVVVQALLVALSLAVSPKRRGRRVLAKVKEAVR